MSSVDSNQKSAMHLGKRRQVTSRETLFELSAKIFYQPQITLDELSSEINLSNSVVKRMLNRLRNNGVVKGRLGSMHLNFHLLAKPPFSYCSANIFVESDIQRLRVLSRNEDSEGHRSEEELLHFLCNVLPRSDSYKGRIVVEKGQIVVGSPQINLVLIAHAVSTHVLFDFSRLAIEQADGVARTQTLMVAFTL